MKKYTLTIPILTYVDIEDLNYYSYAPTLGIFEWSPVLSEAEEQFERKVEAFIYKGCEQKNLFHKLSKLGWLVIIKPNGHYETSPPSLELLKNQFPSIWSEKPIIEFLEIEFDYEDGCGRRS